MNFTSGQKKLALGLVILAVIGGAAAYIFLDPFAEEAKPVAVAPKPQPRAAKPAVKTPVALPAAAKPAAPSEPATTVAPAPAATPASAVATTATPATASVPPVVEFQPPLKLSDAIKPARTKPVSPPSVDLRHCLDQPTNQEIAKCAGE